MVAILRDEVIGISMILGSSTLYECSEFGGRHSYPA